MSRTAILTAVGLLAALSLTAAARAADVRFVKGPTVVKEGDSTKISFAVSSVTDVEVAILDADGKVIRHLAAGVLGAAKPPPAPLKAGLAQELTWDGKDDDGRQVLSPPKGKPAKGAVKVRVRAGMTAKFGRTIGQPERIGDAWKHRDRLEPLLAVSGVCDHRVRLDPGAGEPAQHQVPLHAALVGHLGRDDQPAGASQ
ncbi:hypothetical protein LCGC14_1864580 [marine sediment metagenome]|uniref:FlgD Ig-like domain-containing protein n=1 Tax=marine sediment metagenome TaxID=412755 RepID=A0A0F9GUV0_9ZZZZ